MVGVEPIVDVAHAMEAVLREADRATGQLPDRAVDLLLKGVRAIEQRVQALARRKPIAAGPGRPGGRAERAPPDRAARRTASAATTSLAPSCGRS